MSMKLVLLGMLVVVVTSLSLANAWGSDGKVLLRDVQVLTLKNGGMTTGRRASPIPQLRCVGGSAQGVFNPQIVQCYNRGWDGQDVQWECKADMDNLYRFGEVEVVCEGFDYPDDPYILKGSCGMEYTLEYTKEGREKQKQGSYFGGGWFGSSNHQYKNEPSGKWSGIGDLLVLGIIAFVIYAVYKACISSGGGLEDRQYSSTSGDYPAGGGGGGGWTNPNAGYGRGGYGYGGAGGDDASCSGSRGRQPGTGGGGGFWTGLGLGGLMGYMFGGTGNRGYYGYRDRGYNYGWGGAPGGFGSSHTGHAASSGSASSGTRTASGFGGTRRR